MTKPNRQLLAAAINDWKRHNKGTQGQLAIKCGLRPNNFSEIIRGKRGVSILPVIRIAAQLRRYVPFWKLVQILLPAIYAEKPDMFVKGGSRDDRG